MNYVQVSSDGVKTNRQLLNSLYSMIDMSKITTRSKLLFMRSDTTTVYPIMLIQETTLQFGHIQFNSPTISITLSVLNETLSSSIDGGVQNINSPTVYGNNLTNTVPTSGLTIRCVY